MRSQYLAVDISAFFSLNVLQSLSMFCPLNKHVLNVDGFKKRCKLVDVICDWFTEMLIFHPAILKDQGVNEGSLSAFAIFPAS